MGKIGGYLVGIVILGVFLAGLYSWWNFDLRWRPKTITKHQAEIAQILERSGWVSPGLQGPKAYMISFRGCPDCIRFKQEVWPSLLDAGVNLRVLEVARADVNGAEKSTAAERATVAELWTNRSWALEQRWNAATPETWTAAGIPAADNDVARTAVVEASRAMVEKLTPLLAANGVDLRYPTLVWWTKDGKMRSCACEMPQTYRFVRAELGASK